MMTIWGRATSGNVQKALWALGELGLPFTRIDAGGPFGKTREADYLAMNPNGLVPTLQDGDFTLWESHSIVRYLAREYGAGTLEPASAQARAIASQWMDWTIAVVSPAHVPAFWSIVMKQPTPPEVVAKAQADFVSAMRILNAALEKSAYVAGDTFSMGDIPLGIMAWRYPMIVPERPSLPALERWMADVHSRPAFAEHVAPVTFTPIKT